MKKKLAVVLCLCVLGCGTSSASPSVAELNARLERLESQFMALSERYNEQISVMQEQRQINQMAMETLKDNQKHMKMFIDMENDWIRRKEKE